METKEIIQIFNEKKCPQYIESKPNYKLRFEYLGEQSYETNIDSVIGGKTFYLKNKCQAMKKQT
jgi:hypothetical protein